MTPVLFHEEQRFTQAWVWIAVIGIAGFTLWTFGNAMVQQLGLGRPYGDRPMPDTALWIAGPFFMLLGLLPVWLFTTARLVVEVRPDGLHIRFRPFHRKTRHIPFETIDRVEAVVYRPILEYGGWGIRRGRSGWAYNVSGNQGLKVHYRDGTHLLIGSRDPKALARSLHPFLGKD